MKKAVVYIVIPLIIFAIFSLYRIDSYVMQPGNAHDVSNFIEVQGGDEDDEGTLSLMTVSMYQATPLTFLLAKFQDDKKIMKLDQVRNPLEDENEYNVRQLKLMADSQFNAKLVAFQQANLTYEVQYKGIYVLNVLEGGASEDILKTGDEIIAINGETVQKQSELAGKLENKQMGDEIQLVIIRDKEQLHVSTKLKEIPSSDGRVGLGITYAESKSIRTNPKVLIKTEDIGGPSAGLMFTLEMLNQLLEEDITKGHNIAGTGEMLEDGTVGRIGGIEMKVMAANQDGMEIFFAPDDTISAAMKESNPAIETNYEAAVRAAEKIETDMKIVPVKTVEDAIAYLNGLKVK